jgi:hypothetical protein
MTLPNDSIAVTAGSGQIVATHLVSSKEYEMMMPCDADGHIWGSKSLYFYQVATHSSSGSSNQVHWDLFNTGTAVIVRVLSIVQQPELNVTATGAGYQWLLERTTSIGSGGTVLTAWLPNTAGTVLDASVSARDRPSTGASGSTDLKTFQMTTSVSSHALQYMAINGIEIVPEQLRLGGFGIQLGSGQGIRMVQVTAGANSANGWLIGFTTE